MGADLFLIAVVVLFVFAIFDLIVGVSNDAVNFLNSSLGSRVAPRYVILIIASLGIMVGVSFSSGMMEVARKGIFHPHLFNMPELITIFLAVMIADIILLDLFNTYGLPTSTTVSIVFELLGGAVAISVLKILQKDGSLALLSQYINTSKAMLIIFGILLSVLIAFIFGAIVQFLSRLLFTFDYLKRMKHFGALWGGMALSFITYFILVKGAKGATFITPETAEWIKTNTFLILTSIFAVSAALLQIALFFKLNIFKPIILIGTFALAMAFAANDLVNFIGVPMAGFHAYDAAMATDFPLTAAMGVLGKKVPTESYMLLIAGVIMVITLWVSKKARTVSEIELSLGEQSGEDEKFESIFISRIVVRMAIRFFNFVKRFTPSILSDWIAKRLDTTQYKANTDSDQRPSFDLLRASVNMMVASAIISYATSQKLPLSTTYVTFMVSMGTSFADLAWGRESAVYRITGVLTVIGGWFMTGLLAFTISSLIAVVIFYGKGFGVIGLLALAGMIIWKNHSKYKKRSKDKELDQIFNLKKVTDVADTLTTTFEHMSLFVYEIRISLDATLDALFNQNEYLLKAEKKKIKRIQRWTNIIIANIFKSMRLLQQEDATLSFKYGQTIRRLQKLADGHRDIVLRSYTHLSNHHKGLLNEQIKELQKVRQILHDILLNTELALSNKDVDKFKIVIDKDLKLIKFAEKLNQIQAGRIKTEESKTRLSILFYSIMGNAMMLSKQNLKMMEIFSKTFSGKESIDFDMD
ncbi:MAG: phosphate:sodium symporter [Candidatus Cloacimonetes bacterium 4572_55]|nr:MAG: phosphate:sodium symporter [Candidatus Cloacimonetes bacterium 4572_55]